MKALLTQLITRKATEETFDRAFGEQVCYAAALLVFVLSFIKLSRLELSEAQLFFGALLACVLPLLFVAIGLLMGIRRRS